MTQPPDKKNTQFLNMPASTPAAQEQSSVKGDPQQLGDGWQVAFKLDDKTVHFPVETPILIGRAVDDDDPVNFDLTPHGAYQHGVSRQHASITLVDGILYVEDLDSTNGTRINGAQLTAKRKYRLRDGDELELARLRCTLRFKRSST